MYEGKELIIVNDINQDVYNLAISTGSKLVWISAEYNEMVSKDPNIINASVLAIPNIVSMAFADGDPRWEQMYIDYLSDSRMVPFSFIVTILASLVQKNTPGIIICIPLDDMNIYGRLLVGYIQNRYGVYPAMTYNGMRYQFGFDETKKSLLIHDMYMTDCISGYVFLSSYPESYLPNDSMLVYKLINDNSIPRPFVDNVTIDGYIAYFNHWLASKQAPVMKQVAVLEE